MFGSWNNKQSMRRRIGASFANTKIDEKRKETINYDGAINKYNYNAAVLVLSLEETLAEAAAAGCRG